MSDIKYYYAEDQSNITGIYGVARQAKFSGGYHVESLAGIAAIFGPLSSMPGYIEIKKVPKFKFRDVAVIKSSNNVYAVNDMLYDKVRDEFMYILSGVPGLQYEEHELITLAEAKTSEEKSKKKYTVDDLTFSINLPAECDHSEFKPLTLFTSIVEACAKCGKTKDEI